MCIDKIVFKMHARKCIFYIIQGNSRYCNTSWNRLQLPKVHHTYIAQPVSRQRNTHTHTYTKSHYGFLNKPLNVSAFVHQFHKEKTKKENPHSWSYPKFQEEVTVLQRFIWPTYWSKILKQNLLCIRGHPIKK